MRTKEELAEVVDPRNLAYRKTRWDMRQWGTYVEDSPSAYDTLTTVKQKSTLGPAFGSELFTRLFTQAPPTVEDNTPEANWSRGMQATLDETPEWDELRKNCQGNKLFAGMGAHGMLEKLKDRLPLFHDDIQEQRKKVEQMQEEDPQSSATEQAQQVLEAMEQDLQKSISAQNGAVGRQAVRRAVRQVAKEVGETKELAVGLGIGASPGALVPDGHASTESVYKIVAKMAQNPMFKKLLRRIGSMIAIADAKRAVACKYARSEMAGFRSGSDLEDVLEDELAKLAAPALRLQFACDFANDALLLYETKGKEKKGRGPLHILVDMSGSMKGAKDEFARATAVAMALTALKDKRSVMVLGFDTATHRLLVKRHEDMRTCPETGYRMIADLLAKALASGGGTDISSAMRDSLQVMEEQMHEDRAGKERPDMVVITDGIMDLPNPAVLAKWKDWQAKGMRGLFIQIGRQGAPKKFADIGFRVLPAESLIMQNDVGQFDNL